jgi:hypothetical protein
VYARLDHGPVRPLTRTGLDWTHKYPAITKAVAALDARQALSRKRIVRHRLGRHHLIEPN